MGYALIVGGGTDGRYTISLDIGEAERAALVERFTAQVAEEQAKLATAQTTLSDKQAALDAAALAYDEATGAYIDLLRGESAAETPEAMAAIVNGYQAAQSAYRTARIEHAAALSHRNALSFSASRLTKALADWQAQVLTETREAWCADFTEDASGYVATMEIPGESGLILIAPGGRAAVLATDGYLRSRGLMSPPQAYFNAAVLPGWQKFKPTYRWGTVTRQTGQGNNTINVDLAAAISSAQRLDVNQAASLENVPGEYMGGDASIFEVGDRVVVRFDGQQWPQPRVIGFLDNPRSLSPWIIQDAVMPGSLYFLERRPGTLERFITLSRQGSVLARYRVGRGAWVSLGYSLLEFEPTPLSANFYFDLGVQGFEALAVAAAYGLSYSNGDSDLLVRFFGYNGASGWGIVELLFTYGDEVLLNVASNWEPSSLPLQVAIVGGIPASLADVVDRLDYALYQQTGD